ncbi:hypothetical protein BDF19DRAFT_418881 [Syncephalis fuscata]|nr:hypothetical protein BDF19DRAFT_418881 [Syncephalis fuscata]
MFTLELQHAIFLLRLLQSLGAFIGMALAARVIDLYNREGPGTKSAFNFSLFTNLVGLVLSGLINAAPFLYNRLRWTWTRFLVDPFGETVGSLTFILFFFISGVVVALNAAPDTGGCSAQHFMSLVDNDDGTKTVNDSDGGPAACRTAKAAAAFDFLTLATWIGLLHYWSIHIAIVYVFYSYLVRRQLKPVF